MDRVAVFVDAGYLFAQGSAALFGSKRTRYALVLDAPTAIERLRLFASLKARGRELLRIYWYDGSIGGARLTTDQATLANLDDVKLRLGFVNSSGQQKGVDSLIVTDMIELARLKSITDAILLSGDEDVRVGVHIAQNYGVRVHLLGIHPSKGSQSHQLMQESDTTTEWDSSEIGLFLAIRPEASVVESEPQLIFEDLVTGGEIIEESVMRFVTNLDASELQGVTTYWETNRGVPTNLDGKLLATCSQAIGRRLEPQETKHMRAVFQKAVKSRLA